ncbi:MAG: CDP-diacylglycerol--glycerol-3-phosphate 3-phosphatidyltransferase [Lachnospiraceae bacterium]|nr:CDP-diacylglycerol--glycerol-3-phosphate 3-phosphatidyltransferase [Ruminococcus sp.]MCM1275724.1 CDP-diacylglycerol--glycerol-3-phosphate 3-phosphatidyltransferase [Lachnospiraceae bacterium]
MNLANKLTMFRVIIVPFFVLFMSVSAIPYRFLWALILFALASITDMLDGKIARKYNMVTDFGKFLDPLADKILVAAALICFVELGRTSAWVAFVILAREFVVSGVRLVAAASEKKKVIPANIWGKLKTAVTMVAIAAMLVLDVLTEDFGLLASFPAQLVRDALMYLSAALTVVSGVVYCYDSREFIDPNK